MDPQKELFTALLTRLKEKFGEDMVFDGLLPPEGTPYPFIYMADASQTDSPTKSGHVGEVSQTIDVWHNDPGKRGTISQMMLEIKGICFALQTTDSFSWFVTSTTTRVLPDTTTKQPLLHGVLEVGFKFS